MGNTQNGNYMKIFNTASRSVEEFLPIRQGEVGIYACGPTVYNFAHIGNMRTYIFEDTLRRAFEYVGYKVNHVMNITDVGHLQSDADTGDDKMLIAAKREQKSPWDIAKEYEEAFFRHSDLLNIKRPGTVCRATEHIPEMISMIRTLVDKGFAYEAGRNVYFDVDKFKEYPDFARLRLGAQQSTNRVEEDQNKRNPADFALWFSNSKYPNQIMQWDSPWGRGFPGWHIECSAMSSKYLGNRFDIHCGGIDHIPVHHTNEIAQSDCCHGHKTVNYWMHGAFLTVDEGKMSKSKGDFLTVDKISNDGYLPLSYRYLVLSAHYRGELNFSYEALEGAQKSYLGLREKVQEWKAKTSVTDTGMSILADDPVSRGYEQEFVDAITNDLHTPTALATVWSVVRSGSIDDRKKLALVEKFDAVLGLGLRDASRGILSPEEEDLIKKRNQARSEKDWSLADEVRKDLSQRGIVVKDTKDGTMWTRDIPKPQ